MAKCDCKLQKALSSAESGKEMLEMFEKMEPSLEEEELGFGLLQVSQKLDSEGHDPEKVLSLAQRALRIFLYCESRGIVARSPVGWVCGVISALSVLASSCYKLKKYDESLKYLKWADKNLKKLDEDAGGYDSDYELLQCIQTVQFLVPLVKEAMARLEIETCIVRMTKVLEEDGSLLAIVKACMNVCKAYVVTLNAHDALPFGLKALGVYMKHFGSDSVCVEKTRECLGMIYPALGLSEEDIQLIEEVLEQTRLSSNIFDVLKPVVSSEKAEGALLAGALMAVAPVYRFQGEFQEARDLMATAIKILEMVEIGPFSMATALRHMALVHESMNDIGTATTLLTRAVSLLGLPESCIAGVSQRLFMMILGSDMGEQAIQCLEEVVESLKQSLGPKHSVIGNGYSKLGTVALKFDKALQALKYFKKAKRILDASLGPQDPFSLRTSQMLTMAYTKAGRHAQAIECQEKVVAGFKELGPSHRWEMFTSGVLLTVLKGC